MKNKYTESSSKLLWLLLSWFESWFARGQKRKIQQFLDRHFAEWVATPKKHKVLILVPALVRDNGQLLKQPRLVLPALNAPLLAALTPNDWDVEILYETIEEIPLDTDADLIAISGMGVGLWRGLTLCDEYRKRGKQVVVGGPMATLVPNEVLERADAVCVGDAEFLWVKILRDFERGAMKGIYQAERPQTPALPMPRYDLVVKKKIGWFLPVQAGRGCPYRCEFCSIAAAYEGTYQRRPIADIVRDIQGIKSLGFSKVLLVDDNIASDKAYALKLFAELKTLKITWMGQCALSIADQPDLLKAAVESGCTTLSFGLETVNQSSLDSVNKRFVRVEEYDRALEIIRKAGIDVSTEMILGMDGDQADTFERTADFIMKRRITLPRFYMLTPIPGTPLFKDFEARGRITDPDFGHYNAARVVYRPSHLTEQELQEGYWKVYDRVFSIGAIFKRVLGNPYIRSPAMLVFLLFVNFHYRHHVRQRICPGVV